MRRDVVIVGGGPAGLTAAELLANQGLSVAMVHKGALGGELPSLLWVEGVPGSTERVNGAELASQLIARAERARVTFIPREAVGLEHYSRSNVVALTGHEFVQSSAVVLAMGRARKPADASFQPYEGRGLIGCTACDAGFYRGETVVVCGAGHGGAIDALNLAAHARRVLLVEQSNSINCSPELAEQLRSNPSIQVLLSSRVCGATGSASGVLEAVQIQPEGAPVQSIGATGISVQVGRAAETEFLRPVVDLDERGAVKADRHGNAGAPLTFVVGDVRAGSVHTVAGAISDAQAAAQAILSMLAGQA